MTDHSQGRLNIGVDIVEIARIAESVATFGDRFIDRLFTAGEASYARAAPERCAERLAARFAAKEAAIKALGLPVAGIDWRDLEVHRHDDGSCRLALYGRAADAAHLQADDELALSMSHDGGYAIAFVTCLRTNDTTTSNHNERSAKPR